MRINVFGIRGFPGVQGGVEKHCEELYPQMTSIYKNISFKVFRRKLYLNSKLSNKKYAKIEFDDGWVIKNKYLETPLHSFLCAFKTIFERPDLVHIHNIGPAMTLPLLKIFGTKTIMTYHSANYEHKKWNWLAKLVLRISEKMVFLFADKVIFVSERQMNLSSIRKSKAVFIPNGISDFSKLRPNIKLSDFGLRSKRFILSVGRLVPEKRFKDLILAFATLNSDLKLVIVGGYDNSSEYFKKLSVNKRKLGDKLVFTGFLPSNDLKLLYENAFCFVLPSENEGMPIVLLEAMSFGLCPLVSNIKENLDVIKKAGFSFKVRNINDLKSKLEFLIKNPSLVKKQGKLCKLLVKKEYQWNLIAKKTLEVYNEVLNSPKNRTDSPKKRGV